MKIAIAALGALAFAPLAEAQSVPSSCKLYDDLVAAAPAKFESYRANELSPGVYATTLRPVPYPNCAATAQAETSFICFGNPGSESVMRIIHRGERARLTECLKGWETKPVLEVDGPGEIVEGVRFIRVTAEGELTVGLSLVRDKARAGLYRLGFGVVLRPLPIGA